MHDHLINEANLLLELVEDMIWQLRERSQGVFDSIQRQLQSIIDRSSSELDEVEKTLDSLAWELRHRWVETVQSGCQGIPKSPPVYPISGRSVSGSNQFGYERFGVGLKLESCLSREAEPCCGLKPQFLTFNCGMSAINSVYQACLKLARTKFQTGIKIWHEPGYFETESLFSFLEAPDVTKLPLNSLEHCCPTFQFALNIIHIEPISFGANLRRFSSSDLSEFWRYHEAKHFRNSPTIILLDSTAVGNIADYEAHIGAINSSQVAILNVRSGLKLNQQGLELANLGLASWCIRDYPSPKEKGSDFTELLADEMRIVRQLTGTGLDHTDAALLQVPFITDPQKVDDYSRRVFQRNFELANSISAGGIFSKVVYPTPLKSDSGELMPDCPVVVFLLEDCSLRAMEILACYIRREISEQQILFEQGASFGFRGHRYEVFYINGQLVLRVAMGARQGPSAQKIKQLLVELTQIDNIYEL